MLRNLVRISPSTTIVSRSLQTRGLHAQYTLRSARSTSRLSIQTSLHSRVILPGAIILPSRGFHASRVNQGLPFIGVLASVLKTSTAIEIAKTAARIALTFIPIILLKNHKSRKAISYNESHGTELRAPKDVILKRIRNRTIAFHALLFTPILIFWLTIVASLERTPLTGRWRLILLSPEEEEDIAKQLAGPGWYHAVGDILSREGPPPQLVPGSDWRLSWVQDTLRRLEDAIPVLQKEHDNGETWLNCGPDDIPLPPPAEYPLRPRPRASEYIRRFAELSCARRVNPAPHAIAGPPYSLLLVDNSDSQNAFSYGFGPDGGSGIVVFSGFLDEVLNKPRPNTQVDLADHAPPTNPAGTSWLSFLFGDLLSSTPRPLISPHPIPTEEQTSELAILLAHELSHLILAHHLETLSSGSIIYPGVMSIMTDIVRTLLFPVTMLFGPFINDALAGVGKVTSNQFTQVAEYCTSQKQEIEADIVSARLLAHAGFDPRHAVRFWEDRVDCEGGAECAPVADPRPQQDPKALQWRGMSHPIGTERVKKLKEELTRWEEQRRIGREHRTVDPAES